MGKKKVWLDQVAKPGDECVLFKGASNGKGYGQLSVDGKLVYAHRYVLERFAGPAPAPGLMALHSCGNRACVNPDHLRWGTALENAYDREADGNTFRGETHPRSILTRNTVRQIRALYQSGKWTQQQLADRFGVCQPTISRVCARRGWRHV